MCGRIGCFGERRTPCSGPYLAPNEGHRELETAPRVVPNNGERASKITARERMTDINYDEQSDEGEVVAGRV